ncbi:MAG TPA: glycosyltransferase [Thermoanaerobaculia bacterium]|nr:glycosyltransferase [Thermoanaerobaculia bacterium]
MPTSPELSIVIPVYNEPANIALAVEALSKHVPVPYEIIVVYDFDEDTTVPVLRELEQRYAQVRGVRNSIARGPSGALRTGFAHATAPLVLVTMADLCDDVSQIPQMLELVREGADLVTPSRYCAGGEQRLHGSLRLKAAAPRMAGRIIRLVSGLPTYDPTNSFKLYSASMLRNMPLRSTVSFSVTLEIVAKAHCLGYRIVEVPTTWRDRQHGKTNFKMMRSLVMYTPWLFLTLLRGRIIRLPVKWLRRWLAVP